jgi:hypothetical protein
MRSGPSGSGQAAASPWMTSTSWAPDVRPPRPPAAYVLRPLGREFPVQLDPQDAAESQFGGKDDGATAAGPQIEERRLLGFHRDRRHQAAQHRKADGLVVVRVAADRNPGQIALVAHEAAGPDTPPDVEQVLRGEGHGYPGELVDQPSRLGAEATESVAS